MLRLPSSTLALPRSTRRLRLKLSQDRKLPRLLREAGLAEVAADAFFPITSPACSELEAATVRQIRAGLIAGGYATAEEIDRHLANVATGQLDLATAPMISAWGRRLSAGRRLPPGGPA